MKKLISLMLALIMVFSLATVVSAAEEAPNGQYTASITKNYTTTVGKTPATIPGETLTFTVSAVEDYNNPDSTSTIVFGDNNTYTVNAVSNTIPFVLSGFSTVGKWKFTVNEVAPDPETQGVTYNTNAFGVEVVSYYVTEGEGENAKQVLEQDVSFTTAGTDGKVSSFTNYYDLGTLTVKKTIDGNLASDTQYFDFIITLNATEKVLTDITVAGGSDSSIGTANTALKAGEGWRGTKTLNIKLKAEETVTISNIPAGVTYTVTEDEDHRDDDVTGADTSKGYDVTVTGGDKVEGYVSSGSIDADGTDAVIVNNEKETKIATGIVTDSAPYIILIAVCAVAAVAFVLKRRNAVEF